MVESGAVVIRPRIWEYRSNLLWCVGALLSLVAALQAVLTTTLRPGTHDPLWPSILGGGGGLGICVIMMIVIPHLFGQVLIVTDDQVIVRGRFRASQGDRADVTAMEVRNRQVDLAGADGPVVSLTSAWTMGKYERTAAWLGVPLRDQRVIPGNWRDPTTGR